MGSRVKSEVVRPWRLIVDGPASGSRNQAIDQALADVAEWRGGTGILRLYRWSPACVSLGRHQPLALLDREAIQQRGWEIVRRPTGGGAILHINELTYCLIAPVGHPLLSAGVVESAAQIGNCLRTGLGLVGIAVECQQSGQPNAGRSQICFAQAAAGELSWRGVKLVGSAQWRRSRYLLQHGSLPLDQEHGRLGEVLMVTATQPVGLAGLSDASTRELDLAELIAAIARGFELVLGIGLVPSQLDSREAQRATELQASVYSRCTELGLTREEIEWQTSIWH